MRPEKIQAFTLVELMIVVLILGALAAIAIPRITGGAQTARVNACKSNVDVMNRQIELYYANTGSWPLNLGEVTNDPNYFPDGPPECPFGKKYWMGQFGILAGKYRVIEHLHTVMVSKEVTAIEEDD
ncbi:MAG: prepilin-type N-terminal cleavage/methylation domain-containing protein [Planctomycetes bacterium]|nr:prepilin-type N-terminal cleavage/methylation domain-containing protein [Planctomycetota bacterium]